MIAWAWSNRLMRCRIDVVVAAVAWSASVDAVSCTVAHKVGLSDVLSTAAMEARHVGFPEESEVEVRLSVELTGAAEQELVAALMRAVIASATRVSGSQRNPELEDWAADLPSDAFSALFCGELVVSHSGVTGSNWRVRFELASPIAGVDAAVLLSNYESMLVRAAEPPSRR